LDFEDEDEEQLIEMIFYLEEINIYRLNGN